MTEEQIALARRAVACGSWRWLPGMLTYDGYRTVWVDDALHRSFKLDGSEATGWTDQLVPDLSDPATLGCLLALVREAHAVPFLQVSVKISREHGYQFDCHPHHRGQWVDSEAEALVAALEAVP